MNSGYIMIDCAGIDLLSQSSQSKTGLYAECIAAKYSGKPTIAYNLEYGSGVTMSPIPVFCILEAGVFIATASILQVRVAQDDSVTITSLIG